MNKLSQNLAELSKVVETGEIFIVRNREKPTYEYKVRAVFDECVGGVGETRFMLINWFSSMDEGIPEPMARILSEDCEIVRFEVVVDQRPDLKRFDKKSVEKSPEDSSNAPIDPNDPCKVIGRMVMVYDTTNKINMWLNTDQVVAIFESQWAVLVSGNTGRKDGIINVDFASMCRLRSVMWKGGK